MMEYKVCFHISSYCPWLVGTHRTKTGKLSKQIRYHGKLHYCGHTLQEAVEKFKFNFTKSKNQKCTSMWIMRGREKGRNIKWKDYKDNV